MSSFFYEFNTDSSTRLNAKWKNIGNTTELLSADDGFGENPVYFLEIISNSDTAKVYLSNLIVESIPIWEGENPRFLDLHFSVSSIKKGCYLIDIRPYMTEPLYSLSDRAFQTTAGELQIDLASIEEYAIDCDTTTETVYNLLSAPFVPNSVALCSNHYKNEFEFWSDASSKKFYLTEDAMPSLDTENRKIQLPSELNPIAYGSMPGCTRVFIPHDESFHNSELNIIWYEEQVKKSMELQFPSDQIGDLAYNNVVIQNFKYKQGVYSFRGLKYGEDYHLKSDTLWVDFSDVVTK